MLGEKEPLQRIDQIKDFDLAVERLLIFPACVRCPHDAWSDLAIHDFPQEGKGFQAQFVAGGEGVVVAGIVAKGDVPFP